MEATYIPAAETAKLVRAVLKRSFPRTKFGVRTDTYAGGAAVRVSWMDGPAVKLVERVTDQFAGRRFDSSIDMESGVYHWLLPDGSAVLASDAGTLGQRGERPPTREWMPHPDARLVRFGAGSVSCSRRYSDAFTARVLAKLKRDGFEWDGDEGPIRDGWPMHAGGCRLVPNEAARRFGFPYDDPLLMDVLHRVRHAFMVAAG